MAPLAKRLAWLRSLEAHTYLVELLDQDLQRDCGVPLVWYDVLVKIWRAPDHAIRMSELADQVLLSRSWLTRRVAQLEQAGLLVRRSDDSDGRGILAMITEHGTVAFQAMEASHSRSIAAHFSAHLSGEEAHIIAIALGRIASEGRASLARRSHS